MTTRILPREEWARLAGLGVDAMLPLMPPDDVQIVVVEHHGRIVACWSVLRIVHLEGVWIDPAFRGRPSIARRLLTATLDAARSWGTRWAMTGATDDGVRRLLERHLSATKVPMDTYTVPLYGKTPCLSSH